jgi:uncharacterized protein with von Willebrand factor type A (vWA) domain
MLAAKTNEWKKEFIDYKKNVFIKRTEERIKNLKIISNTLQPGADEIGRLWNYTKGKWKKSSYDVFAEYSEYFLKDITLQELARALGRSREVEIEEEADIYSKQEIEYVWDFNETGKSELVGVHPSGDLAAILPSEIALLTDPDTDMLFYKRYSEKKLLSYEYIDKQFVKRETDGNGRRKKRVAEGPFILCIDTSGSMRGGAEKIAKTIVFALLKFAFKTKRLCYLISFSTEIETLELSDLAASLPALSEFLSMSFNGGSNASPAFEQALSMLEKESYRKADVVVVSDFILPCLGGELSARIQSAKERKTKFHSILVGTLADNAVNQTLIEDFDTNTVYS